MKSLSFTEKKRPRCSLSSIEQSVELYPLLDQQLNSFSNLLQKDVPPAERENIGLQAAFNEVFPIISTSNDTRLEFVSYEIHDPIYDVEESRKRGLTYQAQVYAKINMVVKDKDGNTKLSKEENVFMGEIPLMTEGGSFVVNGTERVVVSQLHRSPGVFFSHDAGRGNAQGKYLYSARIIPYEGCWLDFEFDHKDYVYFRIDRKRKMPVSVLLKALDYSSEEILCEFYEPDYIKLGDAVDGGRIKLQPDKLQNTVLPFDILDKDGKVIIKSDTRIKKHHVKQLERASVESWYPVSDDVLVGRWLRRDYVDAEGKSIVPANAELTEELLATLRARGLDEIEVIYTNEYDCGPYISQTMALDEKLSSEDCRTAIYRVLRPGDMPNTDVVNNYFKNLLFNSDQYNLSDVGRMKLNLRLDPERAETEYRLTLSSDIARCNKSEKSKHAKTMCALGIFPDEERALAVIEQSRISTFDAGIIDNLTVEARDEYQKKIDDSALRQYLFFEKQTVLSRKDILDVVYRLVNLRNGKHVVDDIDSLSNRRIRFVGEFVQNAFKGGLERVQRAIKDRLSRAEMENLMPHDLISARAISAAVSEFYTGNHLSQFMDHTNGLSAITHKRRVSALGVGALNRDRAGFEVRDVHPTHYGRLCPIETPEGPNIGLINSMALFATVSRHSFLQTPFFSVSGGRVDRSKVLQLTAIEEAGHVIAQATTRLSRTGEIIDDLIPARSDGEFILAQPNDITLMDVAPMQIASVGSALIPFLEHDDANRALMGANMQRQAVPCLRPETPLIGTGIERFVAIHSQEVLCADRGGVVDYVDTKRIIIRVNEDEIRSHDSGIDIYHMKKNMRSNQNTLVTQRPVVHIGDVILAGDIIADGASSDLGELSLGQNLCVAFLSWNGFNFEDSIVISENVVSSDRYTSIHIVEQVVYARDTKLGAEEITRDIPNQSDYNLAHLDQSGIVYVGTEVQPGDILVGKVTPKSDRKRTQEERLLMSVFGEKALDVKDTSLRMPTGLSGVVIDVDVFTSDRVDRLPRADEIIEAELEEYQKDLKSIIGAHREDALRQLHQLLTGKTSLVGVEPVAKGKRITKQNLEKLTLEKLFGIRVSDDAINQKIDVIANRIRDMEREHKAAHKSKEKKLKEGHTLRQDVLQMVKVYIAIKRTLQVGDKMAGRHGNKGVISTIVPPEDMPFMKDGTPVDIILNPLGVPSRMNVGQVLESHLGLAARGLGKKIEVMLKDERAKQVAEIRSFLKEVYSISHAPQQKVDIGKMADAEVIALARNLKNGVPFASPIFDGASETDIGRMLKLAQQPENSKMILYDGRSGEPFDMSVSVGYMYVMKLHHLVDEKMHARSTGSYSLITQQPLGGKAHMGGQRFGEMEVWALEAYGAAYTLREMLTVKSDDISGRTRMYENIIEGANVLDPDIPESFNVLTREIRSLGIDIELK